MGDDGKSSTGGKNHEEARLRKALQAESESLFSAMPDC